MSLFLTIISFSVALTIGVFVAVYLTKPEETDQQEEKEPAIKPCCLAIMADHNRYVNAVVQIVGFEVAKKIAELAQVMECEGEA